MSIKDMMKSSRRGFLKGASLVFGGAFASSVIGKNARAEGGGLASLGGLNEPRKLDPDGGLSAILIGTGTPLPNPERACSCTAVIAGDRVLLVDTGRGCVERLDQAGLRNFDSVLFTHFHSDHYAEFGEVVITDTILGRNKQFKVYGPTGTSQVIGDLMASYKPDIGYRKAHHKEKWSDAATRTEISENNEGVVIDDCGLKVTAFKVNHHPVEPALGYKFEYKGKSIVVSGDTVPIPVMVEMSKGADILIHEAVNKDLLNRFRNNVAKQGGQRLLKMMDEMMEYHSDIDDVAEIAQKAGVKKLVITHLVPSIPPGRVTERVFLGDAKKKFDGDIEVGRDLIEVET